MAELLAGGCWVGVCGFCEMDLLVDESEGILENVD